MSPTTKRVRVRLDIYPSRFSLDVNYQYANVRAINVDEQPIVDECIAQMLEEKSSLLLNPNLYVHNEYLPISQDKECILDLTTKQFEFY